MVSRSCGDNLANQVTAAFGQCRFFSERAGNGSISQTRLSFESIANAVILVQFHFDILCHCTLSAAIMLLIANKRIQKEQSDFLMDKVGLQPISERVSSPIRAPYGS